MSNDVQAILNLLNSATLTPRELIEIERRARELSQASMSERSVARREQHLAQARICPHCGMQKALKFGRDVRGRQRFRCRSVAEGGCGKTFTALTGTAFSGMRRRDQWGAFEAAMAKGWRSIDELHASGEVKVGRLTLWRWRHRFLRALEVRPAPPLSGVVEADETYFRDSFKGSRGWKRGHPPVNRKPRQRGKSAKRGLSNEQIPVVAAIDRQRQSCHHVLASRESHGTCAGRSHRTVLRAVFGRSSQLSARGLPNGPGTRGHFVRAPLPCIAGGSVVQHRADRG